MYFFKLNGNGKGVFRLTEKLVLEQPYFSFAYSGYADLLAPVIHMEVKEV